MRRGIGLPQRAPQSLAPRHAVGAPAATASARRRPPGIAWRPSTCLGAHRRPLIVGEPYAHCVPALSFVQRRAGQHVRTPPRGARCALTLARAAAEALELSGADEDGDEDMDDADVMNAYFGVPGMVHFSRGQGGLPRVFLKHPYNESAAEIYLHGACVTQWLRPDGGDGLALRPDAVFSGEAAIESGVKLCFPQYREGPMPEDGFANKLPWQVVAAGLDFLPLPDGFNIQLPDDASAEEFMAAVAAAEAAAGGRDAFVANAIRAAGGDDATGSSEPRGNDTGDDDAEDEEDADADPSLAGMFDTVPPASELDDAARMLRRYMDSGLDPAPYVTLRLTDCEATREHWPHKFELLYKITLMEDDDIDDLAPGPDVESFSTETSGRRIADAMAAKDMVADVVNEDGVSVEPPASHTSAGLHPRAELQASMVGEEEHAAAVSDGGRTPAEPPSPRMQLRLQLLLCNRDAPGSPPMTYQVAQLAHFATRDQSRYGDFVRVRGLGGSNVFDYTLDERRPQLSLNEEDYIHFRGQRVDATFVSAAEATVAVCPGDAAHFELQPRRGFKDMMVYHPGGLEEGSRADSEASRFWAAVGTGTTSVPLSLAAGDEWCGEFVVRFHNRYWKEPVFGEEVMHPIAGIPAEQLEQDGDGEELTGDENYGTVGGLGEDGPTSDV